MARKRAKYPGRRGIDRASTSGHDSFAATPSPEDDGAFPIVGIGASAGGLEAFIALFKALPADTGMAFVLIPHLAPTHASALADILSRATTMPVQEVADEPRVAPNTVYVIPPGREMVIEHGALHLRPRASQPPHRSVDRFLCSLAEDRKHLAIGVILSGTATDGTIGLSAIKSEGGITFAQDDTAQQTGMPHSAIAEGSVDFVLPPEEIAQELVRIARHPQLRNADQGTDTARDLNAVLHVVRQATGVDFTQYKRNTLQRRITRRMLVRKTQSLADYAALLRDTPTEIGALHRDLLIGVTTFFRNPEAFEQLKSRIFPKLVTRSRSKDPVRIWVIGCSTGQEAYSLAIALTEYQESVGDRVLVQIFASDLNGSAIEAARTGTFAKDAVHDVSPERLRRFFADIDGHYRIVKSIRDMCVFSQHNLLADPPFSRIDLLSCRNLLMYLEPALQQKVIPTLYYALKAGGTLWLGSAESIGSERDLFETLDARHKFFTKKPGAPSRPPSLSLARTASADVPAPKAFESRDGSDFSKEGDRVLLARFAPAGVLVSPTMEIAQYRGDVGPFLSPAPGKASLNLLKMLTNGLQVAVRAGILRAKKTDRPTREDAVEVQMPDGDARTVAVEVIPIRRGEGGFWVLFEEPATHASIPRSAGRQRTRRDAARPSGDVTRLSKELADTREYLQSVIEQQEASHEELQSANEEVQSTNEELQSINEELETSKEEIQSANEELSTVNDELQHRNAELNRTNNDLINFLASTHQALVFVGRDLRIRRFTPIAESLLNLMPGDIGRPLRDARIKIAGPDLETVVKNVIDTLAASEYQAQDDKGRWFSLRVRPYRTLDNQIDGVTLVYVDVDAVTRARLYAEGIIATVRQPLVVLDTDGYVMTANAAFYRTFGSDPRRTEGVRFTDVDGGQWDIPGLRTFLQDVAPFDHTFNDFELTREFQSVGHKVLLLNARRLVQVPDAPPLVLLSIDDVTELRQAAESQRQRVREMAAADQSKNEFLAMLAHELRNPLAPIRTAAHILDVKGIPSATSEKARAVIDRQVQMMTRLIEDLLDVARITQGKIDLREAPTDLCAVLRRSAELLQPEIDQRGQTLSVTLPNERCEVYGDVTRLEQAFGNLLQNASKFTRRSGHVWLSAERVTRSEGADELVVRVRDDGIGISAETLPRVFELFKQAGTSPHHASGLGVGLALVERIVTLHGGRVTVDSPGVDKGSEFTVSLPALKDAAPLKGDGATDEPPGRDVVACSILVVDDNVDAADSLADLLRLRGHEVRVTYSGADALDAVGPFVPQIIFLDVAMPGMDGYEVARRLRQRPELRDSLIVALTGFGGKADRERTRNAGFDDHITKPIDPDVLARLLNRLAGA